MVSRSSGIARAVRLVAIGYASLMFAGCGGTEDETTQPNEPGGGDTVRGASLFQQQCKNCHTTNTLGSGPSHTIDSVAQKIEATMPIGNAQACDAECALDVATYIAQDNPNFGKDPNQSEERFDAIAEPTGVVDPAPVVLNRLNNTQYNNTVRDLFGTTQTPADNFPEDSRGGAGQYDTIAGSHSISLTHVEQHLNAAELLAAEVIAGKTAGAMQRFEAETLPTQDNISVEGGLLTLRSTGSRVTATFNGAGAFKFTVRAGQDAAPGEIANMRVLLDGKEIGNTNVPALRTQLASYHFYATLESDGAHVLVVEFTNDLFVEGGVNRNLIVDWINVENQSASVAAKVIPCDFSQGVNCARQVINDFGMKAWRRPLSNEEKAGLEAVYQEARQVGGSDAFAFEQLVKAFILSPNFLYRPELDSNLSSSQPRMLNAFELASRLSYFLWNTTPDDDLLALAQSGALLNENTLRAQVKTMLLDSKATDAFVESFLVQWLKVDAASAPSLEYFPDFAPGTIDLMRQETRLFLKNLFESNAPIREIATADYTYLNQALAEHYGVSGITGSEFQRYTWGGDVERRGILGQGAFLTATAHPVITSPVRRGVWILTNLICKEPPAPPQGVDTEVVLDPDLTARQISELHRESGSSCFGCHSIMDPLGFGLENFDPAGQWRWMDGKHMVDASGTLPGGVQFNGPLELSEVLGDSPRLPMCAIDHMMTYGLGRGTEAFHVKEASAEESDSNGYATVYDVYQKSLSSDHRIHSIIEEIVLSPAFRMRRGADSQEI